MSVVRWSRIRSAALGNKEMIVISLMASTVLIRTLGEVMVIRREKRLSLTLSTTLQTLALDCHLLCPQHCKHWPFIKKGYNAVMSSEGIVTHSAGKKEKEGKKGKCLTTRIVVVSG